MKLKALIPLAALVLAAQAQGAEGLYCVGANVHPGQRVRLANGKIGVVQSVSGRNARCSHRRSPVGAVVEPLDERATTVVPAQAYRSRLHMDLPPGWEHLPLDEETAQAGGVTYARNQATDMGLLLNAVKREWITDIKAYALARRADQASRFADAAVSEVSAIEIGGRWGYRCDVTGTLKSGKRLTFQLTVVEGPAEVAFLNTWTAAADYERQKDTMADMAERIGGF